MKNIVPFGLHLATMFAEMGLYLFGLKESVKDSEVLLSLWLTVSVVPIDFASLLARAGLMFLFLLG